MDGQLIDFACIEKCMSSMILYGSIFPYLPIHI